MCPPFGARMHCRREELAGGSWPSSSISRSVVVQRRRRVRAYKRGNRRSDRERRDPSCGIPSWPHSRCLSPLRQRSLRIEEHGSTSRLPEDHHAITKVLGGPAYLEGAKAQDFPVHAEFPERSETRLFRGRQNGRLCWRRHCPGVEKLSYYYPTSRQVLLSPRFWNKKCKEV